MRALALKGHSSGLHSAFQLKGKSPSAFFSRGCCPVAMNLSRGGWLLALWVTTAAAMGATQSPAKQTLMPGICRVVSPVELPLDCCAAAFGRYLPHANQSGSSSWTPPLMPIRVVTPPEHDRLACGPLTGEESFYRDACVIVDRGGCAFQAKLKNVAAARGAVMLLVNSDDSALMLGAVNFEPIDAAAVSIPKAQGEQLRALASAYTQELRVEVVASDNAARQAVERVQYFAGINAPVAALESYWDAVHSLSLPTLDELVRFIAENASTDLPETLDFFLECSSVMSRWDFAEEAALHAFAGAAALSPFAIEQKSDVSVHRLLQAAAYRLIGAGYYAAGRAVLARRLMDATKREDTTKVAELTCHIAVTRFLEAELMESIETALTGCAGFGNKLSAAVSSVQVAEHTLYRFGTLEITVNDQLCLKRAAGVLEGDVVGRCCYHEKTKWGNALRFSTRFTSELYHALNVMSVFTDELGAFNASLRFIEQAGRLCDDGPSLKFRRATAVPVVLDSDDAMHSFFYDELPQQLRALEEEVGAVTVVKQSVSAHADSAPIVGDLLFSRRPEEAAFLQYTITPSTMMIGYQGYNVLPIQQDIYQLRSKLFPSLTSVYVLTVHGDRSESTTSTRKRVGFISSWFRTHSVGKLLIGVIERLDRQLFEVVIYRCVHFLRDGDDMTERFRQTADLYVELPAAHDAAIARLRDDQLDIVVFPELGMDAWTVLLSHHRVAPVQCVFWGHPITTGNPNIDFSISSQYFVSGNDKDGINGEVSGVEDSGSSVHEERFRIQRRSIENATASERVVLFRGLSTIFTKPSDLHVRRARTNSWKGITRSSLHLPDDRRLYVCPQTLMKLSPQFDAAIAGILDQDPAGIVVLLASETQRVWTEQLRRRFRRRLGQNAYRVRFLPTLPYDEFMALLSLSDVMLDPFPFGGGVTTLDALSLGIPVVTLPSAQTVVQLAAGFLRFMNATEGIVSTLDEYVSFAINVAADRSKKQQIRASLLSKRDAIYEDKSVVEDWNAFLAAAGSL